MSESKVKGLIKKLEYIQQQAGEFYSYMVKYQDILNFNWRIAADSITLAEEYNNTINLLIEMGHTTEVNIVHLSTIGDDKDKARISLHTILLRTPSLITELNEKINPLTSEQADKLTSLRKELSSICNGLNEKYEINMNYALECYEIGQFLGSALIAGRVVNKIIDKIPGEKIEDKLEYLKSEDIIADDRLAGQTILKASKKARNVFAHDLEYISDPQQSLSMITDTIQVMKLLKDFIK